MSLIESYHAVKPVVIGAVAAVTIDGTAAIPLGAAAGVILVVYRMTRRWTQVEDKVESQTMQMDQMGRKMDKIAQLLQTRPCFKGGCETVLMESNVEIKGKDNQ